jgi:hypothetical protein
LLLLLPLLLLLWIDELDERVALDETSRWDFAPEAAELLEVEDVTRCGKEWA